MNLMTLTRFHAAFLLVLSLCAACPGPNPRFTETTSTVSRRGVESVVVNGPACVIQVKDGKWVGGATSVPARKGEILKSDSVPRLPFEDDSPVRITVLPASAPPKAACESYQPTDTPPFFICMRCGDLSDSEKVRNENEIPCCPLLPDSGSSH